MVFAVRSFFEGISFKVYETSYDGPNTAIVTTETGDVRFDILMMQKTRRSAIHYFCECKFRSNASNKKEVLGELKDFLGKACRVMPHLLKKYGEDHFCFLFIASNPFDVWEQDLRDPKKLQEIVKEKECKVNMDVLSRHLRIMIFPNWLISTLNGVDGNAI